MTASPGKKLALIVLLGFTAITRGQDFKPEPGYTVLFGGKDLSGWRQGKDVLDGKTETASKKWHVTDGVIVIDGGGGGDLYTIKEFNTNFHLKLEFRASNKADSGVYLRGIQLQVRDYPRAGPYNKVKFKDNDWNELDITVRGPVHTGTVNGKALTPTDKFELVYQDGKPTAKLNGSPVDISTVQVSVGAVAECKCNGEVIETAFKVGPKGGIGLQSETGKFEFRNIQIKELP